MTQEQIETLWRAAGSDSFLAEMCERWMDDLDRVGAEKTIRSHIRGSKLEQMAALTDFYVARGEWLET